MSKKTFYSLLICLIFFAVGMPPLGPSSAQSGGCNNILRGAVITDYSSSYNDDFAPENLIDGRENRSWSSAEDDEQPYIVFDLGAVFEIDRIQLNGYYQASDPTYEGDSVRNFRLEALIEDQWTTVLDGESPLVDRLVDYQFSAPVITNQIKIVFLSNYGGTSFEAAELAACGQRAITPPESGGKRPDGKENPENEPLLEVHGDLVRDSTDSWDLDAKAGQIITIDFQATTQYTDFQLVDKQGNSLFRGDARDAYIDNTYWGGTHGIQILEDGTYSIMIFDGIGPYTLIVTEGYIGQTVGTITVGRQEQGDLREDGFDRWALPLLAGQIITIDFQTTTQYTDLRLLDPEYNNMQSLDARDAYVDNTYWGGAHGIRVLEDGIYSITVSGGIGPYNLVVSEGYIGQTVGTITVNQPVQGTLRENSFDRWILALSAGQTINVHLEATTQYTDFLVNDPEYRRVVSGDVRQSSPRGYSGSQDFQVLIPGLYSVVVSGGIGDYTLTVTSR